MRLITDDIVKALQRGQKNERVRNDVRYASSESFDTPHVEEAAAAQETEGKKKCFGEDEIFDDKWVCEIMDEKWMQETRKKGLQRGYHAATSHLEGLNWEVLVVDKSVVKAFRLPRGKIAGCGIDLKIILF